MRRLRPRGLLSAVVVTLLGAAVAQVPSLDDMAGVWVPATQLRDTPAISNWRGSVGTLLDIVDASSFIAPPFIAGVCEVLSIDWCRIDIIHSIDLIGCFGGCMGM
jgi:hypothetical protein